MQNFCSIFALHPNQEYHQPEVQSVYLQLEALGIDKSAFVSKDQVGVQITGIGVAGAGLHVCIASPGDGSCTDSRLAAHGLGVLAVLALDGDVCRLMLQIKKALSEEPQVSGILLERNLFFPFLWRKPQLLDTGLRLRHGVQRLA